MDAAVAEPPNPAVGYVGRSIEERVSVLEGTITNQDRIFDMLREGQQNLIDSIVGLRAETRMGLRELHDDMDKRFGEVGKRFGEVDARINETNERIAVMDLRLTAKIDSNLKWILGVQIAMWVTIIAAVLL